MKQTAFIHSLHISLVMSLLGSVFALQPTVLAQSQPTWHNCRTREVFSPEKKAWCDRLNVVQNATYLVPSSLERQTQHINVTLKNGHYQRPEGNLFVELVSERNWLTFGDINSDGKQDAAIILGIALDPKGKAIGTYLTVVMDVDGKAAAIAPIWLGDRIRLNGPITIRKGGITVSFLTMTNVINRTYVIQEGLIERR